MATGLRILTMEEVMKVRLISKTMGLEGQTPQELIAYCARVSNPANQDFEITTSRAIAAQILRHRHFNYQEFSQRYAEVQAYERYEPRYQDEKNKQNSVEIFDPDIHLWFQEAQQNVENNSEHYYREALKMGIAKEQARFLLKKLGFDFLKDDPRDLLFTANISKATYHYKIVLQALDVPTSVDIVPQLGLLTVAGGGQTSSAVVLLVDQFLHSNRESGRLVTVAKGFINNTANFHLHTGPLRGLLDQLEKMLLKKILVRNHKDDGTIND